MTYQVCRNLTGSPVCGDKVKNMTATYYGCDKLTGTAVFGNSVETIYLAYYYCRNLSAGNIYMYSNNIYDAASCFSGKNNSHRYNIRAYRNTTTWNTLYKNDSTSIVGVNITWTNYSNGAFYNKTYNIYVYPL
jgi:hypothetical protein